MINILAEFEVDPFAAGSCRDTKTMYHAKRCGWLEADGGSSFCALFNKYIMNNQRFSGCIEAEQRAKEQTK